MLKELKHNSIRYYSCLKKQPTIDCL